MNRKDLETDTKIPVLGEGKIPSPAHNKEKDKERQAFISDTERVVIDVNPARITETVRAGKELPSFEMAGPREKIYFDPSKMRCALVTCGGLCPGLNDIIRSI
ncbi:MAG: 6-phosphofructokinase 1, partial [Thermodesulfobacteriota bacterium]|nr:6-phosphofructokinase 1 [Thermodesulfobacteriota bacterium]